MTKRLALLLLVLLPIMACSKQNDATVAADAASPAAEAAPVAEAPASAMTPDPASVAAADGAAAATAADAATATAAVPAESGPALVAGTDYVEIPNGQPYRPLDGKVEVTEVFAYWCPHCAAFQPLVNAWKSKLPGDVRFTYVPIPGGSDDPLSRAYFAAEASDRLDKIHNAIFNAIHLTRTLPQRPSAEELVALVAKQGVDPKRFADTMNSFAVSGQLNRAREFSIASGVEGTPTVIVNGKYRVLGKSLEDTLRITNQLIAQQRPAKP